MNNLIKPDADRLDQLESQCRIAIGVAFVTIDPNELRSLIAAARLVPVLMAERDKSQRAAIELAMVLAEIGSCTVYSQREQVWITDRRAVEAIQDPKLRDRVKSTLDQTLAHAALAKEGT